MAMTRQGTGWGAASAHCSDPHARGTSILPTMIQHAGAWNDALVLHWMPQGCKTEYILLGHPSWHLCRTGQEHSESNWRYKSLSSIERTCKSQPASIQESWFSYWVGKPGADDSHADILMAGWKLVSCLWELCRLWMFHSRARRCSQLFLSQTSFFSSASLALL